MNNKCYIILIEGWYQVCVRKPDPEYYNKNARFFEMDSNLPVDYLTDWAGRIYQNQNIKEITNELRS
jgi:hypothetical protein